MTAALFFALFPASFAPFPNYFIPLGSSFPFAPPSFICMFPPPSRRLPSLICGTATLKESRRSSRPQSQLAIAALDTAPPMSAPRLATRASKQSHEFVTLIVQERRESTVICCDCCAGRSRPHLDFLAGKRSPLAGLSRRPTRDAAIARAPHNQRSEGS